MPIPREFLTSLAAMRWGLSSMLFLFGFLAISGGSLLTTHVIEYVMVERTYRKEMGL